MILGYKASFQFLGQLKKEEKEKRKEGREGQR